MTPDPAELLAQLKSVKPPWLRKRNKTPEDLVAQKAYEREKARLSRLVRIDRVRALRKISYANNREKRLASSKAWRLKNPDYKKNRVKRELTPEQKQRANEAARRYAARNPDKVRAATEKWIANNKTRHKETQKAYHEKNRVWRNAGRRERLRKQVLTPEQRAERNKKKNAASVARMKSDPLYAISRIYRGRTRTAFKNAGFRKDRKCAELLGCTWEELKSHIENQFEPGMTWENRGRHGWHVDHVIPLVLAQDEDELAHFCGYQNLRPVWASENLRKGSRCNPHLPPVRRKNNPLYKDLEITASPEP